MKSEGKSQEAEVLLWALAVLHALQKQSSQ